MTTDQDTPVAASQTATETPSQEAPKPRRTTRAKAKTTAKAPSAKDAASKAADAATAEQSAAAKPKRASSAKPKTTAKKVAASAKSAASTGKTSKTATAGSKKTEATPDAEAAASEAQKPAAKPRTTRTTPKSSATGRSTKTATAGKTRTTAAKKAENDAGGAPVEDAAAQPKAPTEKKTAARTTRSRTTKSAATAKSRATAKSAPASAAATPSETAQTKPEAERAPQVETPSAPQSATAKPAPQPTETADSSAVAAIAASSAAPAPAKEISPAQAEAPRGTRPGRASDQPPAAAPTGEPTRESREETASGTAAEPAGEAAATDESSAEDAPRRKNRRGRRGGRGRNRKKEQNGQDAAPNGNTADAAEKNADSDTQEEGAGEARAQAEAKPAAPRKQGRSEPAQNAKAAKAPAESAASNKGKRRMFISVLPNEQVEVALAEDGQLLEYYLDMLHQRKIKGNIYKGVIHNIDTNLQAAFVSYGSGKNGFLQIDEVHPEYWLAHHEPSKGKKFPPIQKVLKAGQEVLVQVVKEPTGSKGAFLTTWLSLAGRFLVLTPGQDQIGVSRKVDDDDERSRLREMMNGIDPGQGLGVIVRTVSAGTTKTTLKNDLQYLKRVWRDIRKKATEVSAPSLIYQEPGLSERAVRDYLTEDVSEIWVDNEDVAQSVRETVSLLFPRRKDLVRVHADLRTPMWERFNLRRQLEQIYSREVLLPSGGRLVFDQTEALMAIDINSGKISGKGNFEAMAHKTNMEAAETIARHLKLRDIGGQVVIDFIEMRDKKHVLEVEKTLRTAMKNDRARHDVARMSSFGLLELVRQRTGSSALAISLEPCPACGGTGMRRNIEWQSLQALRELRRMMNAETKEKCVYTANPELALYLLNHKRDTLREIEQDYGKCLEIVVRP